MRVIVFFLLLVAQPALAQQSAGWYRMYTGKIGSFPVVMHLHKNGNLLTGFYYYQNTLQPLDLRGIDSSGGGFNIMAYGYKIKETFRCRMAADGSIMGNWTREDNPKTLPFSLVQEPAPFGLQYLTSNGERKLLPGKNEGPAGNFQAATVWPSANTAAAETVKRRIHLFFKQQAAAMVGDWYEERLAASTAGNIADPGLLLQTIKDSFFANYARTVANFSEQNFKDYPAAYTHDATLEAQVIYADPSILSIAMKAYSFTGGAHPNSNAAYASIDLGSGKQLALADLLNPSGLEALPRLLESVFRKHYEVPAGQSLADFGLFEAAIKPNANYYVTGKGVVFNYQPYEIAPYVFGEISLMVPFTRLQAYMLPSFANRLKKN